MYYIITYNIYEKNTGLFLVFHLLRFSAVACKNIELLFPTEFAVVLSVMFGVKAGDPPKSFPVDVAVRWMCHCWSSLLIEVSCFPALAPVLRFFLFVSSFSAFYFSDLKWDRHVDHDSNSECFYEAIDYWSLLILLIYIRLSLIMYCVHKRVFRHAQDLWVIGISPQEVISPHK